MTLTKILMLSAAAALLIGAQTAMADHNEPPGCANAAGTETETTDTTTSTETFQGFSSQPQRSPGGQGTSQVQTTTTTTTTVFDINNPNCHDVVLSEETTTESEVISGPSDNRPDQGGLLGD